ncbi:hypothetical protein [Helicobacter cinaedi]|nr:hypothetical protein [Helicobacter cinaedi]
MQTLQTSQTPQILQDSRSPLIAKDYGFYALVELRSLEDTELQRVRI